MKLPLQDFGAYYEERGSGPPLVLVHGLGGSTAMWQEVAGPLSESFRVIAYDLRGLGQSSTPPPPYTLGDLVADLHALVKALGLEWFHLVGHSLGGAIAFGYALEYPERLSDLVAVSAPSVTPEQQRPMLIERAAIARRDGMEAIAEVHAQAGFPEAYHEANPDVVAMYKGIIASGDPEGYAGLCSVIETLDITAELSRIKTPALLVEGELDRIVPVEAVRASAAEIADSEYVELEGCGHLVVFERPHELVAHIREFAGRLARPAPTG